jgi:hypothetical protein
MRPVLALPITGVLAACSACGNGDDNPDAPRPPDAAPDAGPACNGTVQFTGELIDFDSTTTQFMGVFDARFTSRDMPACTDQTAPNGRFDYMVVFDDVVADIDAPAAYLDAIVVAEKETLGAPQVISLRLFTVARAATFYQDRGLPAFDMGRAHVLVYLPVDRVGLVLDATHDAAQAGNDDDGDGAFTWTTSNTGRFVLFPNVDPAAGTATVSGALDGPLIVPVEAGKVTFAVDHNIVLP